MRDQSLAIPQMPVAARPPPSLPKLAILQIPGKMIAIGPQNSGAWLDGLITAITTVRDASDLSAFPYVSFVANLVLRILQAIQVRYFAPAPPFDTHFFDEYLTCALWRCSLSERIRMISASLHKTSSKSSLQSRIHSEHIVRIAVHPICL